MGSTFLLLTAAALLWSIPIAGAASLEIEPSVAVYYFTGSSDKVAKAETESAEGDLKFHTPRDPRAVARDLAREELREGNVCLTQAEQDLKAALKTHQLLDLCKKIYKDELADAAKAASRQKLSPDYFRCVAGIEAHEASGAVRMMLSFRGQLVMHERMPLKLKRAGFVSEAKGWALPVHEAPTGALGANWKEVLKNGSCTIDENALNAFLEKYLEQLREARVLARCRSRQVKDIERLTYLQKQFKEYVPDEWLKEEGGKESAALLLTPMGVDTYAGLKECKAGRKHVVEQLTKLQKISHEIADEHDLPALDPANQPGHRGLASLDEDDL